MQQPRKQHNPPATKERKHNTIPIDDFIQSSTARLLRPRHDDSLPELAKLFQSVNSKSPSGLNLEIMVNAITSLQNLACRLLHSGQADQALTLVQYYSDALLYFSQAVDLQSLVLPENRLSDSEKIPYKSIVPIITSKVMNIYPGISGSDTPADVEPEKAQHRVRWNKEQHEKAVRFILEKFKAPSCDDDVAEFKQSIDWFGLQIALECNFSVDQIQKHISNTWTIWTTSDIKKLEEIILRTRHPNAVAAQLNHKFTVKQIKLYCKIQSIPLNELNNNNGSVK